jgi:replicative DNA helicase
MNLVPYNDDFERAVIVGVLQDPMMVPKITELIEPADFYKENHKEIFRAIASTAPDNLDSLTIEDKLRSNEQALTYFRELVQDSEKILPSLSNIMFYAETIKGKSRLRSGIDLGREITALCYTPTADPEEAIQTLETMFAQFLQARVLDNKLDSTTESFKRFMESLNTRVDEPEGVRSGFIEVDLMLQRLEGLIVLAARPSMGKTAFAINIARNVAATRPVVFFSLEQSKEQVFERLLASEAEVSLEEIRNGAFLSDADAIRKIEDATLRLNQVTDNLHIDDRASIPANYIASVSRQKRYEWGDLGLIVVDYLHIMKHNEKAGMKTDALGDSVNELRALGKELNCPVILLSQLNRQNDSRTEGKVKNRRPELTDLRGSGDIEQSADVVIFLYRDSYYSAPSSTELDVAEIIIKKNRNGRQGIVLLDWMARYVKFKNPIIRRR